MEHAKKIQPRKSSVTRRDVADLAGVSTAVVSYVINNGPRPVAKETRERVLQAIAELGYRPNKYARSLKSQAQAAQHQLGVIIEGRGDVLLRPYYDEILYGIYDEAYRQGKRIRFMQFFDELQDPVLFNELVHPDEISALILLAPEFDPSQPHRRKLLQQIFERIQNVVSLEHHMPNLPSVIFDRAGAARTAVTHLLQLGHRKIAFIGNVDERLDGYRQTLIEHGLSYEEDLFKETDNTAGEAYERTQQLLDSSPPPTAIFSACDEGSFGVLRALHERGIKIPDEIALVSIDDIDLAKFAEPPLSTVRVPRRQMSIHALRMLAMHEAYPDTQPASIVLPTELIVRESCGATRTHRKKNDL